jgi:hypothetical protein
MEQRKLTFLITHLILRIRDYPAAAVEELLKALDKLEKKYGLVEKLAEGEWQAVVESRDDVARITSGSPALSKTSLRPKDIDAMGKKHFDEAVARVRMRPGEEQGDVADLIFALLDEYFL